VKFVKLFTIFVIRPATIIEDRINIKIESINLKIPNTEKPAFMPPSPE